MMVLLPGSNTRGLTATAFNPIEDAQSPTSTLLSSRNLEFLIPVTFGLERDLGGNTRCSKF